MAAQTQLSKALKRPDPMLNFRWIVREVPALDEGGVAPIDESYIESFEVPFSNVKSDGVFFGGGYNYFPGFHDTSAFNINFYSDDKGKALKYLWDWKQKVKNFGTGLYNLPKAYKRDWILQMIDAKGDGIFEATYSGCWPADTGQISLSYEDGTGRVVLNQNFSVDGLVIKFLK